MIGETSTGQSRSTAFR